MIINEDIRSSNIHVFPTQFYSKLTSEGPTAVISWTTKNNINIFGKKLLFVPINNNNHWSLLVIVNPGKIKNGIEYIKSIKNKDNVFDLQFDAPFLMLLDSLKIHNPVDISKNIRCWLDVEASRLGLCTLINQDKPFTRIIDRKMQQMSIYSPRGTL